MNGGFKDGNFSLKTGQFVDSHLDILSVFYFNFQGLELLLFSSLLGIFQNQCSLFMYTVNHFDSSLKYCVYSHALTMDVCGARRYTVFKRRNVQLIWILLYKVVT